MSDLSEIVSDEDFYLNLALLDLYDNQNVSNEPKTDYWIDLEKEPDNLREKLLQSVYPKLNDFQKDVLKECVLKESGGLSLPMGSGKTLLALTLGLYLTKNTNQPILVVAAKSLIASWAFEIKKFFGEELKYEIIHPSVMKKDVNGWKIKDDTFIILTTSEVLSKYYKENHIDKQFIEQKFLHQNGGVYEKFYRDVDKPFLNHVIGGGIFHSLNWGCLIIDEAQMYTNTGTLKCQSLASICADHRWLLSGTLFDEPKVERILGYHLLLNAPGKPRNLPETKNLIWGFHHGKKKFKGLNEHLVLRKNNLAFIPPKVCEKIISHNLLPEEEKIYTMMRSILMAVQKRAAEAKLMENTRELKLFSSYKMVMIMYLRQAIICPIIPIASIAIDASDLSKRSQLSKIIMTEINKLDLGDYLDNINSVKSSRIKSSLKIIEKHKNEKVVVFSCFKSYLDIMQHFMDNDNRPILRMTSDMSLQKRGQLIEDFKKTSNGVLMMTYELGANGLNLQFAATVLLVDFWWNAGKTQQAICRVFRFGQIADQVNIYFFSANTGIEKIIFEKQKAKLQILDELKVGGQKTKVPRIKMDDVIKMIDQNDNKKLLNNIDFY